MTQEFVQASVIRRMLFMLKVDEMLYNKGHANAKLFIFRKSEKLNKDGFNEQTLLKKHSSLTHMNKSKRSQHYNSENIIILIGDIDSANEWCR